MENNSLKTLSNFLLVFVAGFADTATFTAGNEVFSAHVTGNFVVFGYKLMNNPQLADFKILLTFPVFVLAVYLTGVLNNKLKDERKLYLLMSLILLVASAMAYFNYADDNQMSIFNFSVVLIIVFAMGIQNAVNKLYDKSTFGPTTVMTGNVTKATLDFCNAYLSEDKAEEKKVSFKRVLVLISGFLIGCTLGALLAGKYGLSVLIVPAVLVFLYYSFVFPKHQAVS